MGFFSNMGETLGMSGVKLHIELPTDTFPLGSTIEGNVVLTGGSKERVLNHLLLEIRFRQYVVEEVVVESWWGYDYSEYPVSQEDTIAVMEMGHNQLIPAGEEVLLPFEVDIPIDSLPSQWGVEYGIVASADIRGQVDQKTALPIMISNEVATAAPQGVAAAAPMPPAQPGVLNPEARVLVQFTDGSWYGAELGQFDPASQQYYVYFDDGSENWVPGDAVELAQMPLAPGTWVQAPWEDGYYPAQILDAGEGWYLVRWQEDGQESWVGADLVQV